ncbi:MAG: DUF3467 domain-containing protein [Phycisphaeraceae bacterium]
MAEEVTRPAGEAAGQRQVGLRIDESKLNTNYINAFRSHMTAEELIIDMGMNLTETVRQREGDGEERVASITFKATDRLVMNYYTAKRLALMLSETVRRHEQQFGELELNASDRRTQPAPQAGGQSS